MYLRYMNAKVLDASHQRLVRYRKISNDEFEEEMLELVRFVPLIGEEGW